MLHSIAAHRGWVLSVEATLTDTHTMSRTRKAPCTVVRRLRLAVAGDRILGVHPWSPSFRQRCRWENRGNQRLRVPSRLPTLHPRGTATIRLPCTTSQHEEMVRARARPSEFLRICGTHISTGMPGYSTLPTRSIDTTKLPRLSRAMM